MRTHSRKILLLIFLLTVSTYAQTNSWKGLTPLVSGKIDVEKLLGKPDYGQDLYVNLSRAEFKTERETVAVVYAADRCKEGWDVPKDTVLGIRVSPNELSGKSFDELKLDKSKLSVSTDDAMYSA